jgi:ATP-binding cassette subfamily C protein
MSTGVAFRQLAHRAAQRPLPDQHAVPVVAACRAVGVPVVAEGPLANDPLVAVDQLAERGQLLARPIHLAAGWSGHDAGPLLALDESGAVRALRFHRGRYWHVDPQTEVLHPLDPATVQPTARALSPALPVRSLTWADVLRVATQGAGAEGGRLLGGGLAAALVGLLPPYLTGRLVDTVIPGAEVGQLVQLVSALVVVALGVAAFQWVQTLALIRWTTRAETQVQAALWDRLVRLPAPFFRRYEAGDLADRVNGLAQFARHSGTTATKAVLAGLFGLGNAGLMLWYDWWLALLALALLVGVLGGTAVLGLVRGRRMRPVTAQNGQLFGAVLQLVSGIAKLRAAAAEERAFARWAEPFADLKAAQLRAAGPGVALAVLNAAAPVLLTGVLFWASLQWLRSTPPLSAGDLIGFLAAFGALTTAWLGLTGALVNLVDGVAVYERLQPVLTAAPEARTGLTDPGELVGQIELARVTFRYHPEAPPILQEVALTVAPGEFVAIVGPSGSGKSTLLRLLLGLETPQTGAVFYDGRDLAGLDVRALRRRIGTVTQEGQLQAGTLFENIAGALPLTWEQAQAAATAAGLADDLARMPMGLHTVVTPGGGGLSGGQRQRVLIARALAGRPRILFFDEATSALDNVTQAQVSASVAQLRATRIVIAHRLSTVQAADRVIVLVAGRIVESGPPAELQAQGGWFARLAQRQMLAYPS